MHFDKAIIGAQLRFGPWRRQQDLRVRKMEVFVTLATGPSASSSSSSSMGEGGGSRIVRKSKMEVGTCYMQ